MGTPKDRKFVRVSRVSGSVEIRPFVNDFPTLQRAVVERVFCVKAGSGFAPPPRPKPGVFERVLAPTKSALLPLLPSTAPVSHEAFVESYEGRKKQRYREALEEIRTGFCRPEKEAEVNCFVKFEKTDHTSKVDPVPRVISPRDPRYNLRVGRYLKHLEHRLFKSLDRLYGHPTVLKGYNAERSAELMKEKWDMFHNPVAVGLDASRFDQHVSREALQWEHSIYLECFHGKHRARLAKLLGHQLKNKCSGFAPDGEVEYVVHGTRMSGDMNTSLGNCLLMCAMNYAYAKEQNVKIALANNGDDCVVFMEQRDLQRYMRNLEGWFLKMGFKMEVETPVDVFERIEFCQTKPVFDGERYIMCRNPWTAIVKDSVMLNPWQGPKQFMGWLDAVGTGGLAIASRLPVFQSLYLCYQRNGKRRKIPKELLPWNVRHMGLGLSRTPGVVRPEARLSFWLAFAVTPDEQVELEKYYDTLTIQPAPVVESHRSVFTHELGQ